MYSDDNTKYEIAKAYSQIGLSVFPVHTVENGACSCGNANCTSVAKHPLTPSGCLDATKDESRLNEYFSGDYERANIAVATGEVSGIWVMDVDELESLHTLETQYGALPKTPLVRTGGGGRHFYFRHPGVRVPNSQSKIAKKIDVRGDGGYVLLPPSVHASGNHY